MIDNLVAWAMRAPQMNEMTEEELNSISILRTQFWSRGIMSVSELIITSKVYLSFSISQKSVYFGKRKEREGFSS